MVFLFRIFNSCYPEALIFNTEIPVVHRRKDIDGDGVDMAGSLSAPFCEIPQLLPCSLGLDINTAVGHIPYKPLYPAAGSFPDSPPAESYTLNITCNMDAVLQ